MDKKLIYQELLKHAQDDKVSCRQCFDVARELNVAIKLVGETCNENKIRICACQLGCFK